MKYLLAIVDDLNHRARLFGDAQIDVKKLTQADADRIFDKIECDLSPENLSCDGELPAKLIVQRKLVLEGAWRDLIAQGFQPKSFAGIPA